MANGCMLTLGVTTLTGFSASSGGTPIAFDEVVYDDGGWYNSSNPGRLTVPSGVERVRVGLNVTLQDLDDDRVAFARISMDGIVSFPERAGQTMAKLAETTQQPRASITTGPIPIGEGTHYFESLLHAVGDTAFGLNAHSNFWIEAVD